MMFNNSKDLGDFRQPTKGSTPYGRKFASDPKIGVCKTHSCLHFSGGLGLVFSFSFCGWIFDPLLIILEGVISLVND